MGRAETILLRISGCIIMLIFFYSKSNAQSPVSIEGALGIEFNNLDWSIAGNNQGKNPNIFSELKWRQLSGVNYNFATSYNSKKISYFIQLSLSPNLNGKVEDTDYAGDDRTNTQYNEVFRSSRGRNLVVEPGMKFKLRSNFINNLQLITGLRYRNQRLFIDQHVENTQSYYDSRWVGVFAGFANTVQINESISLLLYFESDLSYYHGFGNWKLRADLAQPKSFIHTAPSYGFYTNFKTNFRLNKILTLTTSISGLYSDTFKGKDTLFFKDGSSVATQLNGVKSSMLSVHLGTFITL